MLILLPLDSWDGGRGPQKANMKNKPAVRWLKNILIDFFSRGFECLLGNLQQSAYPESLKAGVTLTNLHIY